MLPLYRLVSSVFVDMFVQFNYDQLQWHIIAVPSYVRTITEYGRMSYPPDAAVYTPSRSVRSQDIVCLSACLCPFTVTLWVCQSKESLLLYRTPWSERLHISSPPDSPVILVFTHTTLYITQYYAIVRCLSVCLSHAGNLLKWT